MVCGPPPGRSVVGDIYVSQFSDLTQPGGQPHLEDPNLQDLGAAASLDPEYTVFATPSTIAPTPTSKPKLPGPPHQTVLESQQWTENSLVLKGS